MKHASSEKRKVMDGTVATERLHPLSPTQANATLTVPLVTVDDATGELRACNDEELGRVTFDTKPDPWLFGRSRGASVAVCALMITLLLFVDCLLVALIDVEALAKREQRVVWSCVIAYHLLWSFVFVENCNRFKLSKRLAQSVCPCIRRAEPHME